MYRYMDWSVRDARTSFAYLAETCFRRVTASRFKVLRLLPLGQAQRLEHVISK